MNAHAQLITKLQSDNGQQLLEIAIHIRGLSQTASAAVIEIGCSLLQAKRLVGHGSFAQWVENACGFTLRSAQNYMRAALLAKGKSETVSLLPLGAIYLLSAKSSPAAVVSTVFEWLAKGRIASETEVQLLLAHHRQGICLDQETKQSTQADHLATLASDLLHLAGPELIRQLTKARWTSVRPELLRLLNATTSSADPRPTRNGDDDAQSATIDLVRDAVDNNLFRAEREAPKDDQNTVCWLVDHHVMTVPVEPSGPTDEVVAGDEAPAPRQAFSRSEFTADTGRSDANPVQSVSSPVAAQIDFLANTTGPLHGIPDFLRRLKRMPPQTVEPEIQHGRT